MKLDWQIAPSEAGEHTNGTSNGIAENGVADAGVAETTSVDSTFADPVAEVTAG